MNSIGGYFELELKQGEHYHKDALRLNTARNCLEYILVARKYTKVFIPYYTCASVLEPLMKLNVEYEFYSIDKLLEPTSLPPLQNGEAFLYTNYFGLKQSCVTNLANHYKQQLIVDNSQAFFANTIKGIDTFYSARKFFGVPDGAYLYTDCIIDKPLETDMSFARMAHLLKRIDLGAEAGYKDFKITEDLLSNNAIKRMSSITESILTSIDYEQVKQKRIQNYNILGSHLGFYLSSSSDAVPMVFPFLCTNKDLRKKLIANKIYVATYWPNVLDWCNNNSIEHFLTVDLLPLPIDQRYGECEMNRILDLIK